MNGIHKIGQAIACFLFLCSVSNIGNCVLTLEKKQCQKTGIGMLSDICQHATQQHPSKHEDEQVEPIENMINDVPSSPIISNRTAGMHIEPLEEIKDQTDSENVVQSAESNLDDRKIIVCPSARIAPLNLMIDSRLHYPGIIYLPNCILRPLREEDSQALTKVYGDAENMKLFRTGETISKEEILNEIVFVEKEMHSIKPNIVAWTIITGDGVIGDLRIYDLRKEAKVRCCIAMEWHNRGIARSLGEVKNSPAIKGLDLPRSLWTTTHPDNLASQHVLQHIGFKKHGTIRRYGTVRNLYALLLNEVKNM